MSLPYPNPRRRSASADSRRLRLRCLAASLLAGFSALALANPLTPTVVSGTAVFQGGAGSLTVSNSNGAIIDWQSFSIGENEITRFVQPSVSSQVLNRVVGGDPSQILGALQSNGRVFLINQNGVAFGPNAQIDVGGLVVSSLGLSNADFQAGRMNFTAANGAGAVINQGVLRTPGGGMIALVAPRVENHGIIEAANGEVILAAGKSANLVDLSRPEIQVEITAADNEALNVGQLVGRSIGIYAGAIRHGGIASANTAALDEQGRIVFKAAGTTLVSGSVEAKNAAGKGGTAHILGAKVGLLDGAAVDVSGSSGGGTVLVGGDYQGKNPDVQNAWRTFVSPTATIRADATTKGDGGRVIVWADDVTRFDGSISAQGGASGGNGGFAEVSGKGFLDFRGAVNLRAPLGGKGMLLLDPTNITIQNATPDINGDSTTGDDIAAAADLDDATNDSPGADSIITSGAIETLLGGADLTLAATANITVNDAVNWSANTLTLDAGNNIVLGAALDGGAGGNVVLDFGGTLSGAGTVTAGTLTLSGAGTVASSGVPLATSIGTLVLSKSAGNVFIDETDAVSLEGSSGGDLTLAAGGAISIGSGKSLASAALDLRADDMIFDAVATITASGAVSLSSKTAGQAISLGSGSSGLGLSEAELNTITAGSGLSIGTASHTGTISLDGGLTLDSAKVTSLTLTNGGQIDSLAASNAIAGSAASLNLTLTAEGGIGATHAVKVGGNIGTLSLTNSTSGNINLATSGAITLGGSGATITQNHDAGGIAVTAGGNLVIAGNIGAVAATTGSFVTLAATGTIARTGGTLTAETVTLGNGNTTQVGADGTPILTAASAVNIATSNGSATVSNTMAGGLTLAASTGGGALSVTETAGILSIDAAGISTSNGSITLVADDMTLGNAVNASNGAVTLRTNTTSRGIDLGTETGGKLSLMDTELDYITTSGLLTIGGGVYAGDIALSAALTPTVSGGITLGTSGQVAGTGSLALASGTLSVSAGTGISLTGANDAATVQLSNATSGNVVYNGISSGGATVTVSGSNQAASGVFTVTADSDDLAVGSAGIVTSNGAISLTANGALSVADGALADDVDAGSAGLSLKSASLSFVSGASLKAGSVTLRPYDASAVLGVEDAARTFNVTQTLLSQFNSSGTVTLGATDHTGNISAAGDNAISLAKPLALLTDGSIDFSGTTINGISAAGLTLSAGAGGTTSGAITQAATNAGRLITTGGGNLSLSARAGIGAANPIRLGAVAGHLSVANLDSGAIDLESNVALFLASGGSVINSVSGGALKIVVSGAGNDLSIGTTVRGTNAADVTLSAARDVLVDATGAIGNASNNVFLDAGGKIGQAVGGTITADGLALKAAAGDIGTASSVLSVTAANFTAHATGGEIAITDTAGGLSIGGVTLGSLTGVTAATAGKAVRLNTGTGTLAVNEAITSNDAAIRLIADDMDITAGVAAGTAAVTLETSTASRAIDLGTDTGGTLGLTDAELDNITTSGLLTIGSASHAADITVSAAVAPANASGGITVQTGAANIVFGAAGSLDAGSTALTLTSGSGAILGNAAALNNVIAGTLSLNAVTGIGDANALETQASTISFANTSNKVQLSNTQAGGLALSGSNGGGAVAVTETAGTLSTAAGLSTSGGAITLAADKMDIGHAISAGSGLVTLKTAAVGTQIQVGAGATDTSTLGLTDAELDFIASTGGLTIGDGATHSGGIVVVGNLNPTGITAGTVTLATTGAITRTGGSLATSGTAGLTLNAQTGIGTSTDNIVIGSLGGGLTVANSGGAVSGDIHLATGAITLGGAGASITQANSTGGIAVTASGNIVIGGDVAVTGAGAGSFLSLDATGAITRTAGTLTAKTVSLGAAGNTTQVGADGTAIRTAAANLNAKSTGADGGIHVDSLADVSLTGVSTTANNAAIKISSTGTLTISENLVAHGSGTVDLSTVAADKAITVASGKSVSSTSGAITLVADNMDIAGGVSTGAALVTLKPTSVGTVIDVGGAATDAAGKLGLSETDLGNITTSGGLLIGATTNTGGLNLIGSLGFSGLSSGTLTLRSGSVIDLNSTVTLISPVATAFDGAVSLSQNSTVQASSVTFASTVNGGHDLSITGNAQFNGVIGANNALSTLSVSGTSGFAAAANAVTTTGDQTYTGATRLQDGNTNTTYTFASTGGGTLWFKAAIDGDNAGKATLAANTGGTTQFDGALGGAAALAALTTNAGGGTTLNGGTVTTTGAQNYNDAVTLGADTTLTTTDSSIAFGSTIDGTTANMESLELKAGSGAVSVTGDIGTTTLKTLTLTSANGANFGGAVSAGTSVVIGTAPTGTVSIAGVLSAPTFTTGIGSYSVSLLGGASLTNATTFNSTGSLTLGDNASDVLTFSGGLTATAPAVTLNGQIRTAGQAISLGSASKAITLAGTTSILDTTNNGNSGGGAGISIDGTVDGSADNTQSLTLKAGSGGTITFSVNAPVGSGSNTQLASLTIDSGNGASFGGAVSTDTSVVIGTAPTGTVSIAGVLSAPTFTTGIGSYNISLLGGASLTNAVTFNNTGTLTLGNDAGDSFSFDNGLTAIAQNGKNIAGTLGAGSGVINLGTSGTTITDNTTIGGSSTGQISLGAVTLADGVTLTLGTGVATPISTSSISGTDGGTKSHLTINTTGAVTVGGAVGTDLGTVTVTNSGGTTFQNTVSAETLALSATTGTVAFEDNLTASSGLTVAAGAYHVSLTGSSNSIAGATTFNNTGTLTLGDGSDTLAFSGGLIASAPSAINLNGTVSTAGTGIITLGDSDTGISVGGNSLIGGSSTGQISLGAVTLADGVTLTLGTGVATPISTSSISGTDGGTKSHLTINTTGAVTVGGAVGTDLGTVTVTNSGGTTFQNTVSAETLALSATTGTVAFEDNLTASSGLTVAAGAYHVSLTGSSNSIAGATTFNNTGTLTLGDGSDTLAFSGGLIASAPSAINLNGTVSTAGTGIITLGDSDTGISVGGNSLIGGSSTGQISLGAVTLADGVTLTLGTGVATPINTSSILGTANNAKSHLTINTTGAVTVGGTVGTDLGTVTVTNSGGTTFQSTVSAETVALTDTTGTIAFENNLTATTGLTVAAGGYSVSLTGGSNSIAGTTSFNNTGTLTLGDNASDILTFSGGLTASAPAVTLNGQVRSAGQTISLGAVTLAGTDSVIDTSDGVATGAAINLGSVSGTTANTQSLELKAGSGGAIDVTGAIGSTTLKTLTLTSANGASFGGNVSADTSVVIGTAPTGTVSIAGVLSAPTFSVGAGTYNLSLLGGAGITNAVTFGNSGTLTLGNEAGDSFSFSNGLTATAPGSKNIAGNISAGSGVINLGSSGTTITDDTTLGGASSGQLSLATVIINDGKTLTLGTGAATPIVTGAISGVAGNAKSHLTINTTGAVTVGGALGTDLGTVTVTNSGGTTFQSTVSAETVALTDTTGTIAFENNLTATTGLTVAAGGYSVSLTGGSNSIAGTTSFNNTGTLTLGDNASDILTFSGGLTASAPAVTLNGQVRSAGQTISLGAVTLAGTDSVIDTSDGVATGAAINLGSVSGTTANTQSLELKAGSGGAIDVTCAIGSTTLKTLTLTSANGASFGGNVSADTSVVIGTEPTGTVSIAGVLSAPTFSVGAGTYNLSLLGGASLTNAVSFGNSGTLTLGDAASDVLTFTGGIIASAPSAINLNGTVSAAGTGIITLGDSDTGISIGGNSLIGGSSTGQISLGAVSLADGVTLTLGTGVATPINTSSILGTANNAKSHLTINTTGAVTVGGTVGTDLGTVTVTNSGGTTFQSTVSAETVALTDTTGTIAFENNLTATTGLTVAAGGYSVSLTGASNSIAGTTSFNNTGSLTLGDSASDILSFSGGLTATAPAVTLNGQVRSAGQAISLGAVTLAGTDSILDSTNNGGTPTGAAINLGSVTGTTANTQSLELKAGSGGAIDVTGAIGSTTLKTLTLTSGNGANFGGNVSTGTSLVIGTAPTGTVSIAGVLSAPTFSVGAGTYHLSLLGGAGITNAVTFGNSGTLTLGNEASDSFSFGNGLTATAPSGKNIAGTLAAGSGVINLGSSGTTITDTTTIGGASTGQISLAAVTINDGKTLTLGTGVAAPIVTGAISGVAGNAKSHLTINTTGAVTVGGTVGTDLGTVTVTNSGGTTFQNTVSAETVALSATTGTVAFEDNLTASSGMTVAAGGYHVSLTGSSNSIAGTTSFNNTGTLTLGDNASDISTFSGGLVATSGSGGVTLNGEVRTAGGTIALGSGSKAITLAGTTSILDTTNIGASSGGANIGLHGTVNGSVANTQSLTLRAGSAGSVSAAGTIGDTSLNTLTLVSANGASFNGNVSTGTEVRINDTEDGQTVSFAGALSTPTLTVDAGGAYHLSLLGGASVTNATSFNNTGTLTLGNDASDVLTFSGGLTATAPAVTLNGQVRSAGQTITLGTVTLAGTDSILDSSNNGGTPTGAVINLGSVTGTTANTQSLELKAGSGGAIAVTGAIGATTLKTLTLTSANGANFGGNVSTGTSVVIGTAPTGTVSIAGVLSAPTFSVGAGTYHLSLLGGASVTNATSFNNTGTLTLGDAASDVFTFSGGLTATAPAVTLNGQVRSAGQAISLGAVTLAGTDSILDSTNNGGTPTGAAINLGSVTGTTANTQSLELKAGSGGAIDVTGAIGSTTLKTLTLTSANGASFGGNVSADTSVVIGTAPTGTVSIAGVLSAPTFTVGAGTYNLSLLGGASLTNAVSFGNTGTLTLGNEASDSFSFGNGLTATAPGGKNIAGTLAVGSGVINLGTSGTTITDNTTLGGASSGQLSLAAVTINDGKTLTMGTGVAAPIVTGAISGVAGNAKSHLTINTTGAVTVGGALGTDLGTVTVTNSGGTNFNGAVGGSGDRVGTVALSNTTGSISFNGDLYATTLTAANGAGGYGVAFNGSVSDLVDAVSFNNSGNVAFGNGGDSLNFAGGVVHTAGTNSLNGNLSTTNSGLNLNSATSVSGNSTLAAGSGQITLGAATLADGVALMLGTGGSGAILTSSISGVSGAAKSHLTFNTTGAVTVGGAVGTDLGTVTVTNSGGTTFQNTVSADTLALTATTGTVAFQDNVTASSGMTVAAGGYHLSLTGASNSIAGVTTFNNTGTLILGDDAGDVLRFSSGLSASAPAAITLNGQLRTAGGAILIGDGDTALTLAGGMSVIDSTNNGATPAGGDITLGGAVLGSAANSQSLALRAGNAGVLLASGTIGTAIPLHSLILESANGASFVGDVSAGSLVEIGSAPTATVSFGAALSAPTFTVGAGSYNLSLTGNTTTITGFTSFNNSGTLKLGDHMNDVLHFSGGLLATASAAKQIAGTLRADGSGVINLGGSPVTITDTSLIGGTSTGQITLGPTTIDDGKTLSVGAGVATPLVLSSVSGQAGGSASHLSLSTSGSIAFNGAVDGDLASIQATGASSIAIGAPLSATTVSLSGGAIDGGGLVTANSVSLEAASGIGAVTALNLSAAQISARSTTGNLDLNNGLAGDVTVTTLETGNGTIHFDQSGGGTVSFGTVANAAGDISLTGTSGLIVAGNVSAGGGDLVLTASTSLSLNGRVDVTGGSLSLTAGGGVSQSAAGDLVASGNIAVTASAGAISQADGTLTQTTGGDISLNAASDVAIGRLDAGTGAVTVQSGARISDVTASEGVTAENIVGGVLRLTAATGIGTAISDLDIAASEAVLSSDSGGIHIAESDNLVLGNASGGVRTLVDGDIAITAGGELRTGNTIVAAGTGNLALNAGTAMILDHALDSGGALALNAGGPLSNHAAMTGAGITANATGIANTGTVTSSASAGIQLDARTGVFSNSGTVGNGGGVNTAPILLRADAVNWSGSIVGGAAPVTLAASSSNRAISIGAAAGGLELGQAELDRVLTSGGLIIGEQTHTAAVTVGGAIADPVSSGGLALRNGGDIAINASLHNLGDLRITSAAGRITDGGGLVDTTTTSGALFLSAHGDIGALTAPVHIGPNASGLTTASVTGSIHVSKDGPLVIAGASNPAGALYYASSGPITQSGAINAAFLDARVTGSGGITLTHSGNAVTAMALSAPGVLTYYQPTSYSVVEATGNGLDFSSLQDISLDAALGNGPINIDAGDGDITLSTSGNIMVSGPGKVLGKNITLNFASTVEFRGGDNHVNPGVSNDLTVKAQRDLTVTATDFRVIGGTTIAGPGEDLTNDAVIEAGGRLKITASGDYTVSGGHATANGGIAQASGFMRANSLELEVAGNYSLNGGEAVLNGGEANASAIVLIQEGKQVMVDGNFVLTGGKISGTGDRATALAVFDPEIPLEIRTKGSLVLVGGTTLGTTGQANATASIQNAGPIKLIVGGKDPFVHADPVIDAAMRKGGPVIPGGLIIAGGSGSGRFDLNDNPVTWNDYPISYEFIGGGSYTVITDMTGYVDSFIKSRAPVGVDESLLGYLNFALSTETVSKSRRGLVDQGNIKRASTGMCN